MDNDVYRETKVVFAREGLTFAAACDIFNNAGAGSYNTSKLSQKLTRGTMQYNEFVRIMDILGYDVVVQKRSKCRV